MSQVLSIHDVVSQLRRGGLQRRFGAEGERIVYAKQDPGEGPQIDVAGKATRSCKEALPSAQRGDYFVDPESMFANDANPGTSAVAPWKTLANVRVLLEDASYKGGVHIWLQSGRSFGVTSPPWNPRDDGSFLIIRAWGSAAHPIKIGSYAAHFPSYDIISDATKGEGAILEGEDPFFEDSTTYQNFIGIHLFDTCWVQITGVRATGFDYGIVVQASRDITIVGCKVDENFGRGIAIIPKEDDSATSRRVTVSSCHVHDNGWNTAHANIVLGTKVADCTIEDCSCFSSTSVRGVDGITLDGCSSGHVIQRNRLYGHFKNLGEGSDGDGLDLKGVRQRDPDDGAITIVRDNDIFDNEGQGIVIHHGCVGVHIFRNRIWRNSRGINIIAGSLLDSADKKTIAYPYSTTGGNATGVSQGKIYIYRNIVGRSMEEGIRIKLGDMQYLDADNGEVTLFRDIAIINNTIDYNGYSGISIYRAFSTEEKADMRGADASAWSLARVTRWFERIGVYNNIVSRNGLRAAQDSLDWGYGQLYIGDLVKSTANGETEFDQFFVDFNLYQMPWQAERVLPNPVEAPIFPRVWQWFGATAQVEIANTGSNVMVTVDTFSGVIGLGETWASSNDNPADPEYLNPLPRDPDHHLSGGSVAISSASWSSVFIPSGLQINHIETGLPVPASTDFDDLPAPSISAFFNPTIGAFHG